MSAPTDHVSLRVGGLGSSVIPARRSGSTALHVALTGAPSGPRVGAPRARQRYDRWWRCWPALGRCAFGVRDERDIPAYEVVEADLEVARQQDRLAELPGCAAVELGCHLGRADPADAGKGTGGDPSGVGEPAHGRSHNRVDLVSFAARVHVRTGWPPCTRICKKSSTKVLIEDGKPLNYTESRCMLRSMASSLHLLADRILRHTQGTSLRLWVLGRRWRLHPVSLVDCLVRATDGRVVITTVTLRSWFAAELARARGEDELNAGTGWSDRR